MRIPDMKKIIATTVLLGLAVIFSGHKLKLQLPERCTPQAPELLFDKEDNQYKHGTERSCWPSGIWRVSGQWNKGKKHGLWIFWGKQGRKLAVHTYQHGAITKSQLFLPPKCEHRTPTFIHGKREGMFWQCHHDGKWAAAYTLRNNIPEGKVRSWYVNGNKRNEGFFSRGKKHGTFIQWYFNGKKRKVLHFQKGKLQGTSTLWHVEGHKQSTIQYANGKRHGASIIWHKNGKKKKLQQYQHGKKKGIALHWDEKGNKLGVVHMEITRQLKALAQGAISWYQQPHSNQMGDPVALHFPTVGAPFAFKKLGSYTYPSTKPCAKGKPQYPANAKGWDKQPWKALRFAIKGKHYAQFTYAVHNILKGDNPSFTFTARADTNCNGKFVIYKINGHRKPGTGEVRLSKITVQNPGE